MTRRRGYTDRFTGAAGRNGSETIDLSPYAGRVVQFNFDVTDHSDLWQHRL
ncbi:MAG: hypothetical protein H6656_12990 [Ardenticatenaceae bacterium]|nr:hypothetical protein [Ardenticatenaceae bacterium]